MFLSLPQLKDAIIKLDLARKTFDCPVPRVDEAGQTERIKERVGSKRALERPAMPVAYGTHGAAFLQIDPVSLEVRCGACAGDLDATVRK